MGLHSPLHFPASSIMSQHAIPLPAIPSLNGEAFVETFMHRELSSGVLNEDFGNAERLSVLGGHVLKLVVTNVLFDKRPMLVVQEILVEVEAKTSDDIIDEWVTKYGLREKVRCTAAARESLSEPEETRYLFTTYVGAAYHQHGLRTVQAWIGKLVDPEYEPAPEISATSAQASTQPFVQQNRFASPPPTSPPSLPSSPSALAILPLFNQMCAQNSVQVLWMTTSTGPPHSPSWTADCHVNKKVIATGAGNTKQLAKEEAAKNAYRSLWGSGPADA
ncbi:hypothetical protein FA95DRAFT_1677836 [Auriscalpium vulgare]|uniref:Uncharacterized protein n=1 Tax=Auriscalpium vulgare TaxID=40419 RepID=A0ACB8RZK3_9AGAM|nr:hypothetical protein FA95DRAFT_1677836 [Auriscalpium vulgare]